jgi:hypothetical protein
MASGCQGSWRPIARAPAAPAAAAARMAAPRLPSRDGFSRRTTGASPGCPSTSAIPVAGRRAMATTPVGGGVGTSRSKCSGGTVRRTASNRPIRSGARARARSPTRSGSAVTASMISASNLSACLSGWNPSRMTKEALRRASWKRSTRSPAEREEPGSCSIMSAVKLSLRSAKYLTKIWRLH